jgi:hypothetical protein
MTTVSHDGYFGEEREPLLRRWYSNAPGHISLTVVRRDLEAYRQLRCGECGRRGPRLIHSTRCPAATASWPSADIVGPSRPL